jgi:hypothetical protein
LVRIKISVKLKSFASYLQMASVSGSVSKKSNMGHLVDKTTDADTILPGAIGIHCEPSIRIGISIRRLKYSMKTN